MVLLLRLLPLVLSLLLLLLLLPPPPSSTAQLLPSMLLSAAYPAVLRLAPECLSAAAPASACCEVLAEPPRQLSQLSAANKTSLRTSGPQTPPWKSLLRPLLLLPLKKLCPSL